MVNRHDDSSLSASGNTEDSRGPPTGALYVGIFGDVIENKCNNTLRIGFQNVRVSLFIKEKLRRIILGWA
jgi:hypothetical protein